MSHRTAFVKVTTFNRSYKTLSNMRKLIRQNLSFNSEMLNKIDKTYRQSVSFFLLRRYMKVAYQLYTHITAKTYLHLYSYQRYVIEQNGSNSIETR